MAYLKDVRQSEEEGEGVSEEWAESLVSESPRTLFVIRGGPLSFVSNYLHRRQL